MTVSTDVKSVRYEGNGVTDTFAFNGRIFTTSDLSVDIITRSTDEVVDTLSASEYATSIITDESAEVVVASGKIPSSTQDIRIYRRLGREQNLRLPTGTVFPAKDVEDALDKTTILIQDVASGLSRSLSFPDNISGITSTNLPTPVDGEALVFDGTTGAITTSGSYITDAVAAATAAVTGTSLITATSTTSLTVTGTGEKIWTIGSGKGFALGQRLRASSDDGTKINEGLVTDYTGTSLTINVDYVSGSGTHADWNIGVIGSRGAAGAGTGDLLAANNLSDVANPATAFATIKQAATETATGVVELATTAEAVTGTDTARAVTPAGLSAREASNVLIPKAIGYVDTSGGSLVTKIVDGCSVARASAGNITVTLDTAMDSTNYVVVCSFTNAGALGSSGVFMYEIDSTTQFRIRGANTSNTARDGTFSFAVYGNQ